MLTGNNPNNIILNLFKGYNCRNLFWFKLEEIVYYQTTSKNIIRVKKTIYDVENLINNFKKKFCT